MTRRASVNRVPMIRWLIRRRMIVHYGDRRCWLIQWRWPLIFRMWRAPWNEEGPRDD